jgi:hypothetical protein
MRLSSILCLTLTLSSLPGCRRVAPSTADMSPASGLPSPVRSPRSDTTRLDKIRLVFAAYEGDTINLYTSNIDGSSKKAILSEDVGGALALSIDPAAAYPAMKVRVSPDGHSLDHDPRQKGPFGLSN